MLLIKILTPALPYFNYFCTINISATEFWDNQKFKDFENEKNHLNIQKKFSLTNTVNSDFPNGFSYPFEFKTNRTVYG